MFLLQLFVIPEPDARTAMCVSTPNTQANYTSITKPDFNTAQHIARDDYECMRRYYTTVSA